MNKTTEELNLLKQEYEKLSNKLKELSEDELKQIVGAIDWHTILPDDDFWHSWNPSPLFDKNVDKLNLLKQEDDGKDVNLSKCEFSGSVSNREDK